MNPLALRRPRFITIYGPGAILDGHTGPGIIPVPGQSNVFTTSRPIRAFEIIDLRLSAALLNKAHIVQLPSNADLNLSENHEAYATLDFPSWSLRPMHQIIYNAYERVADNRACPECEPFAQQAECSRTVRRLATRFVLACPQGHLDDVPRNTIMQQNTARCQPPYLLWQAKCAGSIKPGTAYYACLPNPEISCEHYNTRLDRTLLKENLP
ncbi:MAG TPA: hypothetical protein VGF67_28010 [Ktedonobacteraceae bacterium]